MIIFFGVIFGFILIATLYHFLTRGFLNPYKLIMIFGKKGSGKTTLLCKIAFKYLRQGIPVYSTEVIPGCYQIDPQDVGYVWFPPGSVLLIDEVGMIWDNRNFKNFKNEVRDWFKLQRHRKVTVYMFSQTFDVDKKLRDLTDEMYLVEKKFRVFSYAKRINKLTVLNKSTAESPSKLDEDLQFDSFLLFWCGSRQLTFIPRYARYFDSFVASDLEKVEYPLIPCPELPTLRSDLALIVGKLRNRFKKREEVA